MRKLDLMIPILGLLVAACSSTTLIPTTPTPPAEAPLPLPTEMLEGVGPTPPMTPTQVPSTVNATPTFIDTATVAPTNTMVSLITVQPTSTSPTEPTPQGPVFNIVTLSGAQINWGASCTANSVTVIAQVTNGFDVTSVLLFTRLQSQTRDVPTPWNDAISMHNDGLGTFTYDLAARGITHSQDFLLAWVQYQLVATNSQNRVVGRTQVYLNNLTIAHCP